MAPSPGRSPRRLLGLVGAPGAGKSTVAEAIAAALGEQARVVPMDGYHLAQAELERLGRAGRKGAPDTFDSDGYVALLRRLRTQTGDERVYAPEFRREIEEPVAGAIGVHGDTPLIVTEGNYLLLEQGPWQQVAGLLDEVWYVDVDETARRERLKARHMRYGRSEQQALDWMAQTDDPNARLIAAGRARAHWILSWD
ncbi:nucleoside/nucleotide kinase family protein [Sphaerotilus hippei]|nr:nucleoside/nucleotide kinase family protein [Sphaerotilus hippei]